MRTSTTGSLLEKMREDAFESLRERQDAEQQNRVRLRDFATQLREPGEPYARSPASTSNPSFKLGEVSNFPHVAERGEQTPGAGHMSPQAMRAFDDHLRDAAMRPDAHSRDQATGRAAKVVAQDWGRKHGFTKEEVKQSLLHEARAQVTYAARELGQRLGLGPMESQIVGYSLERALEKEGFKVLASHAVDKAADLFKPSSASTAAAAGMRHSMETSLNKSMQWLAAHGVSRDALKDALGKHAGKFQALTTLAQHPEAVQRAAQVLSKSDKAVDGLAMLVKDDEFRKAVGGLTLASGEAVAHVHKGIGSVAILAGSALQGDSAQETGRHAFRAALSVLGGALGGAGGSAVAPGFGTVAGAVAGSSAGSALADKILAAYDKYTGNEATQDKALTSTDSLKRDSAVVADRVSEKMRGKATEAVSERMQGLERSYSMGSSGR